MSDVMKFGYGDASKVDNAVTEGTIDEKDLVLTKDTSELIYIKSDKTKQFVRPRVLVFESESDAITQLNQNSDTYAGQPIAIKGMSDDKYYPYTVQQDEDSFTVEPVTNTVVSGSGMIWTEF